MLQSLDNIDPDKLFREIWYSNSSSMNVLKDPEEVATERQAKQAAMEEQMAVQQAPAIADAAQKLSGAVDPTSVLATEMGVE